MRLLVIGGESLQVHNFITRLQEDGCIVEQAASTAEANYYLSETEPDACVLCIDAPRIGGSRQILTWRKKSTRMAVVVYQADSSCEERIHALNAGADDVFTGSQDTGEIKARLSAIVRRCHGETSSMIVKPPYALDTQARTLSIHGMHVKLTFFEYVVLETLMRRAGAVVSRETLLNRLYPGAEQPDSSVLNVLVCRLRKKLSVAGGERCLISLRLFGYSFRPK